MCIRDRPTACCSDDRKCLKLPLAPTDCGTGYTTTSTRLLAALGRGLVTIRGGLDSTAASRANHSAFRSYTNYSYLISSELDSGPCPVQFSSGEMRSDEMRRLILHRFYGVSRLRFTGLLLVPLCGLLIHSRIVCIVCLLSVLLFHRRTRASYVCNGCLAWYNVVLTHGSTQA